MSSDVASSIHYPPKSSPLSPAVQPRRRDTLVVAYCSCPCPAGLWRAATNRRGVAFIEHICGLLCDTVCSLRRHLLCFDVHPRVNVYW